MELGHEPGQVGGGAFQGRVLPPAGKAKSVLPSHLPGELRGPCHTAPLSRGTHRRAVELRDLTTQPGSVFTTCIRKELKEVSALVALHSEIARLRRVFWPHGGLPSGWVWLVSARMRALRACSASVFPPGFQSEGVLECRGVCSEGPGDVGFLFLRGREGCQPCPANLTPERVALSDHLCSLREAS